MLSIVFKAHLNMSPPYYHYPVTTHTHTYLHVCICVFASWYENPGFSRFLPEKQKLSLPHWFRGSWSSSCEWQPKLTSQDSVLQDHSHLTCCPQDIDIPILTTALTLLMLLTILPCALCGQVTRHLVFYFIWISSPCVLPVAQHKVGNVEGCIRFLRFHTLTS